MNIDTDVGTGQHSLLVGGCYLQRNTNILTTVETQVLGGVVHHNLVRFPIDGDFDILFNCLSSNFLGEPDLQRQVTFRILHAVVRFVTVKNTVETM